nr:MAG TPA: hypothetical protein [Caudoviricetes sp.]
MRVILSSYIVDCSSNESYQHTHHGFAELKFSCKPGKSRSQYSC